MSQRVVLGVGGGIAAYKVAHLLRLLTESGLDVRVVPTRAALNFVGKPTWEALSGHPVSAEVWDDVHDVPHVRIAQEADLVIVAPATADLIAKAAHGLADDLLTNVLLTTRAPVIFAPAMHTEMWEHPATVDNVATLRRRGIRVLDPGDGRLTGSDSGAGRLPEPEELARVVHRVLARRAAGVDAGGLAGLADLEGRRVVVSAGGTREPIDPVRYLGNRSSGRQGYALAATALARGAEVVLISANVSLPDPAGAKVVRVGTAEELRVAVLEHSHGADAVVMAAAVADFRPSTYVGTKIKKSGDPKTDAATEIKLERTVDVLAELVARRRRSHEQSAKELGHEAAQVIVGFAAETGDALGSVTDHGRAKLAAKGCDLMVINEVGIDRGFERGDNEALLVASDGTRVEIALSSKEDLADIVWDHVTARW